MVTLLRMPEVTTGATEAVVTTWVVAESATAPAGAPLVVIETEKAAVEVEAESDTQVVKLLVPAGSTVAVGDPIAVLAAPGEEIGDLAAVLAGLGVGSAAGSPAPPAPARDAGAPAPRVFVSPLARRLLREAALTAADVVGTGPNGRITRRDVERAVTERAASEPAASVPVVEPASAVSAPAAAPRVAARPGAPAAGAEVTRIPHSGVRRAIARRLTQSKQSVPHFYLKGVCELDALLALRRDLNDASATRVSVNDLLVKAVAVAHGRVPGMNVAWSDDELLQFGTIDVGVAMASERGLVTPVVRDVGRRSVSAVGAAIREFGRQAGEGSLRQSDIEGGSITVTNLGMFGVAEFSAIINPPQAAILAVGAGREAPVVRDGVLAVHTELTVVLSVDHRCVDGALAARWMQEFRRCVERPLEIVL